MLISYIFVRLWSLVSYSSEVRQLMTELISGLLRDLLKQEVTDTGTGSGTQPLIG